MTPDDADAAQLRQAMWRLHDSMRSELPTLIAHVREVAAEAEAVRTDPRVSIETKGVATNVALACKHFLEQSDLPVPLTEDRVNLLFVAIMGVVGAEVTGVVGGMRAQHYLATRMRGTVDPRLIAPSVVISDADQPKADYASDESEAD